MAYRGGGGEMGDLRDTFVSYLLTNIIERMNTAKTSMMRVSRRLARIERAIMSAETLPMDSIRKDVQLLSEPAVVEAILVVAADDDALRYFIYCVNNLSFQLMRPAPRVTRTKQLFNEVRKAWRIAVGFSQKNWEEILQLNSVNVLKEVPIIKSKAGGMKEFMAKVKNMMSVDPDEDDKKGR